MTKTILALAFVSAFAYHATADDDFTKSGTSLETEDYTIGVLDVETPDVCPAGDGIYWATNSSDAAVVTEYGSEKPYEYSDLNPRDELFGDEQTKYLSLDVDIPTERLALSRAAGEGDVSDLKVSTTNYDGIYVDTLVKFTPCVMAPDVDNSKDRIVVWLYEQEDGDATKTNLMITAGRYVDNFKNIERHDYMVTYPEGLDEGWHRLTIRTIADVTGENHLWAAGYEVYIDGYPAIADEATYDVGAGYRDDWLTPQSRVLIGARRLYPSLSKPGHDGAKVLTRLSFAGMGAVDDLLFTSERPCHVDDNKVFTLEWDAGVKSMTCVVVCDGTPSETYYVDATDVSRYHDFPLEDASAATITISDVVYDTDNGYLPGVWEHKSGCTLSGNVFTYDGKAMSAKGWVRSTRDVIGIGGSDGYQTFDEAKTRLKQEGKRVIELHTNVVITSGKISGYNDDGCFSVANGDDIVLDLMGHTLQGQSRRSATINQTGGKLRITDSVGGGRVLPYHGISVNSHASQDYTPELTIAAGTYDGDIAITSVDGKTVGTYECIGKCVIEGGVFTNTHPEQATFYLNQYVTNTTAYYALTTNYWSQVGGAGGKSFVWSGKGANTRWDNADNWQCKDVPSATDLAVFPFTNGAWSVDFGTGVAAKRFRLDADISMSGTNEFSDVAVEGGTGVLVGTGMATFTGSVPGVLTKAEAVGDGKIHLGAAWQGTVKIAEITSATKLANITWWGNAGSTVEFAGVFGYIMDKSDHALAFNLVLTDDGDTPAWRNNTGYAGSTISFPKLSGTGTFSSQKNSTPILQNYQFKDVSDFRGAFNLGGKRLVLGDGEAASDSKQGSITFADAACVRSGLKWSCVNAHFGATLNVNGAFNDTLMTYTGDVAPEVSDVKVYMSNGTTGVLQVVTSDKTIVIKPLSVTFGKTVSLAGQNVLASTVAKKVSAGDTLTVSSDSSVSISGNDVLVDDEVVSTVANYYKLTTVDAEEGTFKVELDEETATPSLSRVSMEVDEESGQSFVRFNVANTKSELWYGIETATSLADGWQAPRVWEQAKGTSLELTADAAGASGFYRVVVKDKDPSAGTAE